MMITPMDVRMIGKVAEERSSVGGSCWTPWELAFLSEQLFGDLQHGASKAHTAPQDHSSPFVMLCASPTRTDDGMITIRAVATLTMHHSGLSVL